MGEQVNIDKVFVPSKEIVARNIEGELIIVPLSSNVGENQEELYTLNDTGKAVWKRLDGEKTLRSIIDELKMEYDAEAGEIETDVIGLAGELLKRRIIDVL